MRSSAAPFECALVDAPRLEQWMDSQGLGAGPVVDLEGLKGGTQNVLVRFKRDEREYVLRRPSRHPRPESNATMLREAQVLAALRGTDVPHPQLIAACDDVDVLGCAFYLMEAVSGFNPTVAVPYPHAGDPTLRHRLGLAMADGAASLAGIDPFAVGLGRLGKLDGYLERQVRRWSAQLESNRQHASWPGPQTLPGIGALADWLTAHRPGAFVPGIVHGDYHLANVLVCNDSAELAAIVDWELVTLGDPLLDLGWLLATWPDRDGHSPVDLVPQPWSGFPQASELVARYALISQRDLAGLRWHSILACYKLAVVLEGTHARSCSEQTSRENGARLHAFAGRLVERGLQWVEQWDLSG
jgi:aminoglycoside phosphotransferase (APT) family kinase protein